ncbi:MAG: lysostaphin resistance A-like protein, partial [Runella sp.]
YSSLVSARAAIMEELLYRGYYQKTVFEATNSTSLSIFFPAVIFGLSHWFGFESIESSCLYVLATFIKGLIYGLIAKVNGSYWYSIAFHFGWNILPLSGLIATDCEVPENDYLIRTYVTCGNLLNFISNGEELPVGLLIYYLLILFMVFIIYKKRLTLKL